MEFKNYRPTAIRANDGSNTLTFQPHEVREVPKHLEELALSMGAVPMDAVEDFEERKLEEAKALVAAAEKKEQEELEAAAKSAEVLQAAAEKAEEELTPQQKAARTRAANKAKAEADK